LDIRSNFMESVLVPVRPGPEILIPNPVPIGPVPKFWNLVAELVGTGSKTRYPISLFFLPFLNI